MLISPRTSNSSGVADITVQPNRPGNLLLKVRSLEGITGQIVVNVPKPSIKKLTFGEFPSKVYVGTFTPINVKIIDSANNERTDVKLKIRSSDDSKVNIDTFNNLEAKKAGSVKLFAEAEGITQTFKVKI